MKKNKKIEELIKKWKDNNYDISCFSEKDRNIIIKYAINRKKYILKEIRNNINMNRNKFFPLMNEVEELNQLINHIK